MNNCVYWILAVEIKDGKMDDFKSLMEEMVAATNANEPDTLAYDWSLGNDGKTCHILERYRDSSAVMVHMSTFGAKFAARFMALATPRSLTVYGAPDETVKSALKPLSPVYQSPFGGFTR